MKKNALLEIALKFFCPHIKGVSKVIKHVPVHCVRKKCHHVISWITWWKI